MKKRVMLIVVLLLWGVCESALASTTGMPWESPLSQLLNSLKGPVALSVSTLAVLGFGFGVSIGESGTLLRKGLTVGLAISLVAGVTSLLSTLFGLGSAALM